MPVLGAAAVIWSARASIVDRIGAWAPVAYLGQISFAAYLWHWPMIVILPSVTQHSLTTTHKIAILLGSLGLAGLSTRFVEDPVRFNPRLLGGRRPLVVAVWCGSAMALIVSSAAVLIHRDDAQAQRRLSAAKALVTSMPRCLGAQSMDPALAPCNNPALAGTLAPDPSTAVNDQANMSACWRDTNGRPNVCHLGPANGATRRILAVGDSHNNALVGAYRYIADTNKWRVDVAGYPGCYLTTAVQSQATETQVSNCVSWRRNIMAIADTGHYDAIIVTHAAIANPVIAQAGMSQESTTVNGLVGAWKSLPRVPIIAISDNPHVRSDINNCVVQHRDVADQACAVRRTNALSFDGQAQAARQVPNATYVDLSDFYCTPTLCSPVIGHVLVYAQSSHLTATYARTLAPYLNRAVVRAVG